MTVRTPIPDFQLANPLYKGAAVSFFTVAAGVKTNTLATLYSSPTPSSTTQLANPQKLNSQGQFKAPVYIDAQVIGVVSGIAVPGHDTAISSPAPTFRVDQSTGKLQYSYDALTFNDSGDYIFKNRGAWLTATAYNRNDTVAQAGALYLATSAHTSGVFATDLAAGKWTIAFSFAAAALTQNRIPYANASGLLQDSANMTFDDTTFKLGVTKFTVAQASGNTVIGGTVTVSGAATLSSTLGLAGNLSINTNKFTVAASSGNTAVAGTLGVSGVSTFAGNVNINSGAGLSVAGGIDVNSTKFNVNASTGNVIAQGTVKSGTATGIAAGGDPTVGLLLYSTGMGFFAGSGAPTLVAPKGSYYARSDGSSTSTRGYIATDSVGGWTNVVTGA